ncbi:hypothetical protein [Bordetella parapertussis]|uniref:hypothetical protein n=1 Tax=Bordetella parapertussis TaxID=519 RepID=UPI001E3F673F|nr:hypothetical protein [Bordetella parapertussis]
MSLITTGAPMRSATRRTASCAPVGNTPPPTYSTGRRAWPISAAAAAMACSSSMGGSAGRAGGTASSWTATSAWK